MYGGRTIRNKFQFYQTNQQDITNNQEETKKRKTRRTIKSAGNSQKHLGKDNVR